MRRLQLLVAVVIIAWLAAPAAAQTGRVQGVVRDVNGRPIKGATVKATHPEAVPRELTSTTDERGRFAILGMRTATTWHFVAEAPGFFPSEGNAPVRSNVGLPLTFTLRRDPGPIPGALTKDIQEELSAANALRDEGRYDEAIAAYQSIQSRNTKLTMVNLVLAGVYRDKAEREPATAARHALLERAMAAYEEVLKDDAGNERAKIELAAVAADLKELTK